MQEEVQDHNVWYLPHALLLVRSLYVGEQAAHVQRRTPFVSWSSSAQPLAPVNERGKQ
jgi:hypothetical protein